MDPTPTHTHYVLIRHEVAGYPAWKMVFDGAADDRRAAGEISYQMLRHQMDPNRIVHSSAWTTLAQAKPFFESPKLTQIRTRAGVLTPEFHYLEQREADTL